MKIRNLTIIAAIVLFVFYSGCDSPSDSKAVSITPPALVSPNDGDTTVSVNPVFSWTNEADKFEIDDNGGFTSPNSYVVSGTQFTLPFALEAGHWYYWRAGISSGSTTYWSSDIYHFRTLN